MKEIVGWKIRSRDEEFGKVADLIFDWNDWIVHFVAIQAVPETLRIIPCDEVIQVQPESRVMEVRIMKNQLEDLPAINSPMSVAEQVDKEREDAEHLSNTQSRGVSEGSQVPGRQAFYLRSAEEMRGYRIQVRDGEAGKIDDLLIDTETWSVLYMVIDTGFWLSSRKVLMAPTWIEEIRWQEKVVLMDLKKETIEKSPEYDPESPLSRTYEERLFTHYQRPGCWNNRNRRVF